MQDARGAPAARRARMPGGNGMDAAVANGIGASVRRKEDMRLLTGAGCFADDIQVRQPVHAVFVRSPHAHARIRKIDVSVAAAMPGVLAVWTGQDALKDGVKSIPHATGSSFTGTDVPLKNIDGTERLVSGHPVLIADKVRFTGEPVAMVIADSQNAARDAAEKVSVDWDVLKPVTRSFDAVKPQAPQIYDTIPGNVALDAMIGDSKGVEEAFAKADHKVKLTTWVNRVTGVHMEPRASLAEYDAKADVVTLHASLGIGVVVFRNEIAGALGIPVENVRIIVPPDVGGNFGTRNATYPEFVAISWAARKLRRPVKHVPDRTEAFLTDYQARDLFVEAELAMDAKGRFLAVRTNNLSNLGGHTTSFVALNKGVQLMTSVYDVPVACVRGKAVLTNTPPTIPYRSAGRPEAMFVVERLIDVAAQQCGF
ncbi:MAG: xanthine dehydrogenase family protein molybdopterin-binding subunit, partial [Alphaproteobacteria bacterium]|nr:xanthine dehydrogenase family protein molybdopterin-binding subunit [Alphaproteobacteria bacterium]